MLDKQVQQAYLAVDQFGTIGEHVVGDEVDTSRVFLELDGCLVPDHVGSPFLVNSVPGWARGQGLGAGRCGGTGFLRRNSGAVLAPALLRAIHGPAAKTCPATPSELTCQLPLTSTTPDKLG